MGREQRQFIQFIAALTMLIDHIGMVFFPSVIGFRAIGRLSFPLFAFGIAEGVRYTHCFWRYFGRILLTAVLSQPIYMLLFGITQGNRRCISFGRGKRRLRRYCLSALILLT